MNNNNNIVVNGDDGRTCSPAISYMADGKRSRGSSTSIVWNGVTTSRGTAVSQRRKVRATAIVPMYQQRLKRVSAISMTAMVNYGCVRLSVTLNKNVCSECHDSAVSGYLASLWDRRRPDTDMTDSAFIIII